MTISPSSSADHDTLQLPSPEGGRVLVVDDVPANVRLLAGILRVSGFEVQTANGGREALDLLQTRPLPDIVLLDVMMPDVDGFQVCAKIKNDPESSHLPVVMVTALNETSVRVAALEAGADDFLSKPVDEVEVVARVKNLVRAKRSRDELQRAYADLRRAEEMRDNLTAMLVHDLRTPLTSMLMPLDLLRSPELDGEPDARRELVAVAHRSATRLLGMVNDLLDVSKLEAGEVRLNLAPLDVPELISDVCEEIAPLCVDGNVQTRREVASCSELPLADEEMLRRVLVNLLANAVRFAPRDSSVEVSARCEGSFPPPNARERWHGSPFRELNDVLVISVRDEGVGIAWGDQERIWDKFAQAEARRESQRMATGLGLTFCKLAVEAHGGGIWVESRPGQGATFTLALPLRGEAE